VSRNTALTRLECNSNQLMSLDLSKCKSLYTFVGDQYKCVVASSMGSNQYSIDVPADFNLSKVSSFIVNSVSVTPTLSNGKLLFTSSFVPTSVSYFYNTDNRKTRNMEVTITITVESGMPTSLHTVEADGDDDTYYNLSGQRVNKPSRSGIYIQRGKKVVVK